MKARSLFPKPVQRLGHWAFFKYQRSMWYLQQAKTEYDKPMGLLLSFLSIITALKVYDVSFTGIELAIGYAILALVGVVVGWILMWSGVTSYNNSLNNKQNKELLEILKQVQEIKVLVKRLK